MFRRSPTEIRLFLWKNTQKQTRGKKYFHFKDVLAPTQECHTLQWPSGNDCFWWNAMLGAWGHALHHECYSTVHEWSKPVQVSFQDCNTWLRVPDKAPWQEFSEVLVFSELNAALLQGRSHKKKVFLRKLGEEAFRRRRVPKGSATEAIAWSAAEATHDASGCPTCILPLAAARGKNTRARQWVPTLRETRQCCLPSNDNTGLGHLDLCLSRARE